MHQSEMWSEKASKGTAVLYAHGLAIEEIMLKKGVMLN